MAEEIEVILNLKWTFGVSGPDGRTRHVGPGPVTLPLNQALAIGGNRASATYRYAGKKYTAETLHEAPEELLYELRRRGVRTPETAALPSATLADIEGVGDEMAGALADAGYKTVAALAAADPAELSDKVAGIGPKTAPRLISAAQKIQSAAEGDGG